MISQRSEDWSSDIVRDHLVEALLSIFYVPPVNLVGRVVRDEVAGVNAPAERFFRRNPRQRTDRTERGGDQVVRGIALGKRRKAVPIAKPGLWGHSCCWHSYGSTSLMSSWPRQLRSSADLDACPRDA